jgi:hypothetical protein
MKNRLIVFCLCCGGHFKVEQTYQVKMVVEEQTNQDNFYICEGCYEELLETEEMKNLRVLK